MKIVEGYYSIENEVRKVYSLRDNGETIAIFDMILLDHFKQLAEYANLGRYQDDCKPLKHNPRKLREEMQKLLDAIYESWNAEDPKKELERLRAMAADIVERCER